MALRPIVYHIFPQPLPYAPTLSLQQQIHELQLRQRRASPRSHQDILLLLQHRPVYTAGRRQNDSEVNEESLRLRHLGADFVATRRGGQTTYHGPGQVVGYPLFDLGRMRLSIAEYICKLQTMLKEHFLRRYGIVSIDSDNTGVFLAPDVKIASIGVQVRHRLTSHGFAYNTTREPLAWFNQVVACGLADVKAGCVADAVGRPVSMQADVEALLQTTSRIFDREVVKVDVAQGGELEDAVGELEAMAGRLGAPPVLSF
ncbi:lipoyltransferase [Gautieria morchelliformis]|nr:lipoyltransferase [Gautieria morchelliformis]